MSDLPMYAIKSTALDRYVNFPPGFTFLCDTKIEIVGGDAVTFAVTYEWQVPYFWLGAVAEDCGWPTDFRTARDE